MKKIEKKLKMIGRTFPGELKDIADPRTIKILEEENTIVSNWWYFDGELEEKLGYDKGEITNLGDLDIIVQRKYFNGNKEWFKVVSLPDGIYETEVWGVNEPCVAYLYNKEGCLRGLVVLKSDKKAIQRAEEWVMDWK